MVNFTVCLAGMNIGINSIYQSSADFCKGYLTDSIPDFNILISKDDIDFERKRSVLNSQRENLPIYPYSDEYLETLAIYRKIADKAVDYNTILFHGSTVAVDGECYLFTAKSGTGKSTHTRLWREYFGSRAVMVNDDKPLIKVTSNEIFACGTPWNGKHRIGNNICVPLKAVCILERGSENHIEPVSKSDAWKMFLQQSHRTSDPQKLKTVIELLDKILSDVGLYSLACNMDIDAAKTAYFGMNNTITKRS